MAEDSNTQRNHEGGGDRRPSQRSRPHSSRGGASHRSGGGRRSRRPSGERRDGSSRDDRPRRRDGERPQRSRDDRREGYRGDRRGGYRDERDGDGRGSRDDRRRDSRSGSRDDRRSGPRRDDRSGPARDRDKSRGTGRGERRDSRPGQEARAGRPFEPEIPEGITGRELDKEIRSELRGLSKETAERVGQHLAAALLLEESEPDSALDHARFAARIGGRVGVVREIYGILAYRGEDFRTALRELRTAVRITGRTDVLPMIADSERGMGRPERALDLAASEDAADLGADATIELMIVVAGAYADTGDVETALRTLEIPALRHKVGGRWQVRLWVAYADLLERAGRHDESVRWLTLAADADHDGETDAAERLGRPAPVPAPDPSWADDEQIAVLDAYSPDADADAAADNEAEEERPEAAQDDAPAEDAESVDAVETADAADETPTEDAEESDGSEPAAELAPAASPSEGPLASDEVAR